MSPSTSQFAIMFGRTDGRCAYCGCELSSTRRGEHDDATPTSGAWVVDRWTPVGGFSDPRDAEFADNYWPSCRACQDAKGGLAGDTYILERLEKRLDVNQETLTKLMDEDFRQSLKIPRNGRLLFSR